MCAPPAVTVTTPPRSRPLPYLRGYDKRHLEEPRSQQRRNHEPQSGASCQSLHTALPRPSLFHRDKRRPLPFRPVLLLLLLLLQRDPVIFSCYADATVGAGDARGRGIGNRDQIAGGHRLVIGLGDWSRRRRRR